MSGTPPAQASPPIDPTIALANVDRRIALAFGWLILALMSTVLVAGGLYLRGVMQHEEEKLSTLVTQVLANAVSRVSFSGKYHARLLLEEIQADQPAIRFLRLVDAQGHILAHSDPSQNDRMLEMDALIAARQVLQGAQAQSIRRLQVDGEPVREVSLVYRGGYGNHVIGVIQIGLSDLERNQALTRGMLFIAVLVAILLALGMYATHRLSAHFGRPVRQLVSDMTATLHAIPDMLFEMDRHGRYLNIMAHREELLAGTRQQMLGHTVGEILPSAAAETILAALREAAANGESFGQQIMLPLPQGTCWFELSVAKKAMLPGQPARFVVLSRNITERHLAQEQLQHQARHDPLTGLSNRLMLHLRLEHAMQRARREGTQMALLMIDLDRFKDVNDSFGHLMGDALLREVAARLVHRVRNADTVSRLGGDEFTVLIERIDSPAEVARLADDLIRVLSAHYCLPNGTEVAIGATLGIALFPDHGETESTLLQGADAALYQAKNEGRGRYRFFTEALTEAARTRLDLEARLRRALAQNELILHFQPQIDIKSGALVGAEALVRWQCPHEGLILPGRFISVAEQSELIEAIGEWVLRETCRQGQRWAAAGVLPATLAVNVSPRQLLRNDFGERLAAILDETGFPGHHLELELTESALMTDQVEVLDGLQRLRALGIRLAIDDFGTGYSSLAYLKRFPIDVLKIDKSFVDDIPRLQDDMEIAAAIIAMAHTLRLKVLAEGVETAAQLDFLETQGCDIYQGYLKSRPLPVDAFTQLLQSSRHT